MIDGLAHLRELEVVEHIVPIVVEYPKVIALLEVSQDHVVMVPILLFHRLKRQLRSVFNCFRASCCHGLFRMVLLSQFAIESIFARTGTVELPHNKSVFLNKIKDGFIFVRYPLEPLVLVNVALDNVNLSIQDIMEMFAFVKHGQTVSVFVKSIAFLDSYGNRHEREAVQSFLPSA